MLCRRGQGIEVVFVASCQSEGIADNFVKASIPHVIAVTSTERVLDSNARVFATTFYAGVIGGQTVLEAFNNARDRVRMEEDEIELTGRGREGIFKLMGTGEHGKKVIFPTAGGSFGGEGVEDAQLLNDISPEVSGFRLCERLRLGCFYG